MASGQAIGDTLQTSVGTSGHLNGFEGDGGAGRRAYLL